MPVTLTRPYHTTSRQVSCNFDDEADDIPTLTQIKAPRTHDFDKEDPRGVRTAIEGGLAKLGDPDTW